MFSSFVLLMILPNSLYFVYSILSVIIAITSAVRQEVIAVNEMLHGILRVAAADLLPEDVFKVLQAGSLRGRTPPALKCAIIS